jgi:hypothetical protein
MSMLITVVSTSVGCEGIDVSHNECLLIVDEARVYAGGTLKLMLDRTRRLELSRAGQRPAQRLRRRHSVVEWLERFHTQLVAEPFAGAR